MFGLGAINKTCIQGLTPVVLGTILGNTSEMSELRPVFLQRGKLSCKKESVLKYKYFLNSLILIFLGLCFTFGTPERVLALPRPWQEIVIH